MLTLEYLWVEYEKFWFSIMCHDWLNVSGHSLLRKETSTNCTDVNAIPESSQIKPMPEHPIGERTLQWMISATPQAGTI